MAYAIAEGALCALFGRGGQVMPVVAIAFHKEDKTWMVMHAREQTRLFVCKPHRLRRIDCDQGEVSGVDVAALYSNEADK